jgi:hypothetical protein
MNLSPTPHPQPLVISDGLAGLLAAQALTRFFRQVVVVEQAAAAAPLTAAMPPYPLNGRDQAALDELFPGLPAELVEAGAIRFNLGLRVAWSVNGRWRPRYRSAYDLIVAHQPCCWRRYASGWKGRRPFPLQLKQQIVQGAGFVEFGFAVGEEQQERQVTAATGQIVEQSQRAAVHLNG